MTKTCNVVAYRGTTKVTPTVGTVSGMPTGMTITKGSASSNGFGFFLDILPLEHWNKVFIELDAGFVP